MKKTDRHFKLITFLQGRSRAVTAERLAEECEVSTRTIYRDIQALVGSGVPIEGEAGVGYLLDQGYNLPPLSFDVEEIEALVLGMAMVCNWTDEKMAKSARAALDKIKEALPDQARDRLYGTALFSFKSAVHVPWTIDFSGLRQAIRDQKFVDLTYEKSPGNQSRRRIRPLALAFFGPVWLLFSWCELRQDFRNFRIDRITEMTISDDQFVHEIGKRLDDCCEKGDFRDELRR